MARLIYSAIMSLDGYIADAGGRFEWAAPDEEVFAFVNDLERPVGTYLRAARRAGHRGRAGGRIPAVRRPGRRGRRHPGPAGPGRLNLALTQEHRFGSGTVYLCYRPA